MEWDVFISEDKDSFVRPLANRLQEHALKEIAVGISKLVPSS
jgi:hypothetical protein